MDKKLELPAMCALCGRSKNCEILKRRIKHGVEAVVKSCPLFKGGKEFYTNGKKMR